MPNSIAFMMLMIWPVIMVVLFKKLSPDRALVWSFLGAFMLLPPEVYIDLPLIPTLNKYTLPSIVALVLCLTMVDQKIRIFPASRLVTILMVGFVLSPIVTVLSNREPVFWGVVVLPGLSIKDAISVVLTNGITLIPFILGFNLLSTRQARRAFLTAYMTAGLIYSLPILLEVRVSPQINNWVYGYFPELFVQQIRFGGYRPMVFMGHGLVVAFFTLMAILSAAVLGSGSGDDKRARYLAILAYLLVVLILCKTVGVILFAILFLPVILFAGPRLKGWAMLACAVFVLTYPVLRATDAIPVDRMVSYAALIQAERAQSLEYRFDNEKRLLDHAAKKPVAGWGYWNRNRVFDEITGRDLTVPDGYWIIIIGVVGWIGYVCVFGLLTYPLLRLWGQRKNPATVGDEHIVYGIALMLGVNLLDLIPNSTINYMTWTLAGLLLACSIQTVRADADTETEAEAEPDTAPAAPLHKRHPRDRRHARKADTAKFQRKKRPDNRMER